MDAAAAAVERRVGRGAIWAFAGRILGVLAQVALLALLPRYVTPAEFGAFTLLTNLMMIFGIIGVVGLNDGNVRFLAEAAARGDGDRLRFLVRGGLRLTFFASVLCGAVAGLGLWLSGHSLLGLGSPVFLCGSVAIGIVLLALQLFAAESLRGLHHLRAASFLSGGAMGGALTTAVFVVAATIAVLFGVRSVTALQGFYLASLAAVLPLSLWLLSRTTANALAALPQSGIDSYTLGQLFRDGLPYLGVHLLVFATMNADLWLVNAFCSMSDVGLYSAARRWMLAVAIAGQIAAQATVSSIPDLAARGRLAELELLLRRAALWAWLPSAAVSVVLLTVPGWVLGVVSGPEYAAVAPVLQILAAGNLLVACFGNPIHVLIMTGRQYVGLAVYAVAALLLAIGGAWAGAKYGLVGVATATAICTVLQSGLSWWLAKRLVGVWTHPSRNLRASAPATNTLSCEAAR